MPFSPQNFVLLRDQHRWPRAVLAGLNIDADGAVTLARLPGTVDGVAVDRPGPYDPSLAAFAVSPCGETILASDADRQIALVDTRCANHRWLLRIDSEGRDDAIMSITSCAATRDRLYVADRAGASVQLLSLPRLDRMAHWHGPFVEPVRVAVDAAARIYVLDAGTPGIVRLRRGGRVDGSYRSAAEPSLAFALDLAVAGDGAAFVSVQDDAALRRASPDGTWLPPLAPPDGAPAFRPGALALDADHLYIADRATGALWMFARAGGRWLAPLPGFRAPVTALAVDEGGHLCVRTGHDVRADTLRLEARGARIDHGVLEAGGFDAGAGVEWMRVHVDADLPAGTRVRLEVALQAMPETGVMPSRPPDGSWRTMPSLDALVHRPGPSDRASDPAARVLFVRLQLESDGGGLSPHVRQITAETAGDDYLSRLPAVYAREDAANGFLRAWLEAFRAELGDRELEIGELSRRLDPATAPDEDLPWLASWIACDLPVRPDVDRRQLLLAAHRLYERRGTVAGVREMVRLYTGLECEIVESFRARRLWLLGAGAGLGFDTGLLATLPDGMAVPGPTLADPERQGLSAAYFFEPDMTVRADLAEDRDPDGTFPSLAIVVAGLTAAAPRAGARIILPIDAFAGVWTGQIRPRFSELYTFFLAYDGGVRLFVDEQPLIDTWTSEGARESRGYLPVEAGRWYPIRIEYWARSGRQRLRLSWSSESQARAVVPSECLYAVTNDNVDPDAYGHGTAPDHLVVGDAVVGEHGPLAATDFGSALFGGDAHHWTVFLNARDLRAGMLAQVRAVLDAEKPAHTDYHLCVVEPQFCVGVHDRIGIDAIVAPPPATGRYDEGMLSLDARLGGASERDGTLRVEETLRIGSGARLR